jgi:hypothetical protein
MKQSTELLSDRFLQMRERCLSLAADLDRLGRASGGLDAIAGDPRYQDLRRAMAILLEDAPDRARRVLDVFSDHTSVIK